MSSNKKIIRKLKKQVEEQRAKIEDLEAQLILFKPGTIWPYTVPYSPYPGDSGYPYPGPEQFVYKADTTGSVPCPVGILSTGN